MIKNYLILLLFCITLNLVAQNSISIHLITEDSISLETIYIKNIRTKQITQTDIKGKAILKIEKGDSINISAIHIETLKKRYISESPWIITIVSKTISLENVILKNHTLIGNLLEDIKNIPKDSIRIPIPNIDFRNIKYSKMSIDEHNRIKKEIEQLAKAGSTQKLSNGISIDIASIYKLIKGKKNKIKTEEKKDIKTYLLKKYGENLFTNDLKIPKEKIDDFIGYVKENSGIYLMIDQKKDLEIINILIKKSESYVKILNNKGSITLPKKK